MKSFNDLIKEAVVASAETKRLQKEREKVQQRLSDAKRKGNAAKVAAEQALLDKLTAEWQASKLADKNGTPIGATNPNNTNITGTATPTINAPKPVDVSKLKCPHYSNDPQEQKDFEEGWKEAMEQIAKAQEMKDQGNPMKVPQPQKGQNTQTSQGVPIPSELVEVDPSLPQPPDSGSGGSGSSGGGDSGGDSGDGSSGSNSMPSGSSGYSSGKSRDSINDPNTGVVRPEDCADPTNRLGEVPSAVGGVIPKDMGDKLADAEGYDKDGGNDNAIEREWQSAGEKISSGKQVGSGPGWNTFIGKLISIWRGEVDWKNELRKVVGRAISPAEKRQAFANKNVLVSQDRISRTDKDKYDTMEFVCSWVDVSGSMTQEFLNSCITETYQMVLAKKPVRLDIFQFDARVTDIQQFKGLADLKKRLGKFILKGGGGTDVKCCFDTLKNDPKYKRKKAELVLIFTDGLLSQYKRDPKTMGTLVWVVYGNPTFKLKYPDPNTKLIYVNSEE